MGSEMKPDREWMDNLKVGDVLLWGRKETPRVIRDMSMHHIWSDRLGYVTFAIRRCSWTHRPYTLYNRSEVRAMGKRTRKKSKISSQLDKKLDYAIHDRDWHLSNNRLVCCDVIGVLD